MRRLGDFLVAFLILVLTSPLLICVAVAIRWETAGPILERRERVGPGGRHFQMLQFRTTLHNPKDALRPWAQRTTKVGQLLRHTRIDALPQLINVLRGEINMADTFLLD